MSEYVLTIRNETTGETASNDSPVAGQQQTNANGASPQEEPIATAEQSTSGLSRAKVYKTVAVVKGVESIANNAISFQMNTVALKTGATEYQQKLQYFYQVGKKVVDLSALGVVAYATGNLPLAAFGAAISVATVGINYMQNENNIRIKQTLEDVSVSMANVRMGTANSRGQNQ